MTGEMRSLLPLACKHPSKCSQEGCHGCQESITRRLAPEHPALCDRETEEPFVLTYEKATPLYIGPLPHYTRRMLQALDGYWLHRDGLPRGRYPRSRSTAEDWWGRFEKYRALAEGQL